jgi:osmotically-inducible protein OsmY
VPDPSPQPSLTARIERQLAEAGLPVTVEDSDGTLVVTGIVDSDESRQAVLDIVAEIAPSARVDDQLDIEVLSPTDVDHFVADEPRADMAESLEAIVEAGGEVEPDFTGSAGMHDPNEAVGPDSWGPEDVASDELEVYTPPNDPVVTTDSRGQTQVLGGFETEDEVPAVETSALDNQLGDEAIADAVRQALREDSATTDLTIVVAVRQGVAHLRGQVADIDDADNAEAVAARVPGVLEVIEELEVVNV